MSDAQGSLFDAAPARTVAAEDVREDHTRRKGNRDALAALLADEGWHAAASLVAVAGWRYGARLFELRRKGLVVHRRCDGPGLYSFRQDNTRTVQEDCWCTHCLCPEPGTPVPEQKP